jgi:hypothetical protein
MQFPYALICSMVGAGPERLYWPMALLLELRGDLAGEFGSIAQGDRCYLCNRLKWISLFQAAVYN